MDSWFHSPKLSLNRNFTSYQPHRPQTIGGRRALRLAAILIVCALTAYAGWAQNAPGDAVVGFAPASQNLLMPLLSLAPAGQHRMALETFEQIHELDRRILIHPALSAQFQSLIDRLPPPEVVPIEMPSLYGSTDIPWQSDSSGRYVEVEGRPDGGVYLFGLGDSAQMPQEPGRFVGILHLSPIPGVSAPSAVIAELKASLYLSSRMTPAAALRTALGFQREIYGTLAPPWDAAAGRFNAHDAAALARLSRDLPATTALLEHYLDLHNVLDEFRGGAGPWVLFNIDAAVKQSALAPYPHLLRFWREMAGRVEAQTVVRDDAGRAWLINGLNRGRITVTFGLCNGMLAPMDSAMRPAGAPIPLEQIRSGSFHTQTTLTIRRFGMRLGMSGIRFATAYTNGGGRIGLDSHMTGAPELIAPPIIHPLTMLIAGDFLEAIAKGNNGRGLTLSYSAGPGPQGGTMLSGSIGAELRNAAALAIIARTAAAFAPGYGAQVRAEQRRLTAEFFAAFDSDYRRSRPFVLSIPPRH